MQAFESDSLNVLTTEIRLLNLAFSGDDEDSQRRLITVSIEDISSSDALPTREDRML